MGSRDEAKVRVKLDTGEAKRQMSDLVKFSGNAASRLGSILGSGVRAAGLGAGIGIGIGAIRGPLEAGASSIIGEALGGYGAQLENWAFGDLAPEARAARAAREQTIGAYAAISADLIPPSAYKFHDATKAILLETEKGKARFERDGYFRGPGIDELIEKVITSIRQLVIDGFTALGDRLNPLNYLSAFGM